MISKIVRCSFFQANILSFLCEEKQLTILISRTQTSLQLFQDEISPGQENKKSPPDTTETGELGMM